METQIRSNVFETNSSSCHSIVIPFGVELNNIPSGSGPIFLTGDEFGWGPSKHTDAWTKMNYCFTYVRTILSGKESVEKEKMLISVIEDQTGRQVVIDEGVDEKGDYGYIDHQSKDVASKVFADVNTLKDFLFSTQSILRIDNDNY